MSRVIFAINITLDGCCDHTNVIADDELHQFYADLIARSAGVLFGRVTYELLESYWPSVARDASGSQAETAFARTITEKPKYVFSHTFDRVKWSNSVLMKGQVFDELSKLKQDHREDLVVLASPGFAATLSGLGLIDEYQLLVQPILAGHGPALFHNADGRRNLRLIDVRRFNSGVVLLKYVPDQDGDEQSRGA